MALPPLPRISSPASTASGLAAAIQAGCAPCGWRWNKDTRAGGAGAAGGATGGAGGGGGGPPGGGGRRGAALRPPPARVPEGPAAPAGAAAPQEAPQPQVRRPMPTARAPPG